MSDLVKQIVDELIAYTKDANDEKFNGDAKWTKELKKRLARLGEKNECRVCTSGFKGEYDTEWLYDMVWYKEETTEDEIKYLTEVPLVMESEWNLHFNHIKYDFEKLLLANANLKLFVCYVHSDLRQHRLNYFEKAVKNYKYGKEEDTFLIAMLDYNENEFYFWIITKEKCTPIDSNYPQNHNSVDQ